MKMASGGISPNEGEMLAQAGKKKSTLVCEKYGSAATLTTKPSILVT